MTMIVVNPADGSEVGRYEQPAAAAVAASLDLAQDAFLAWRARPVAERADLLRALAETLRANRDDFVREGDARDGKDPARGRGRGREVGMVLPSTGCASSST
jgi:acyl-CoA reductase-like NAD-dependent aldehyde dehydrogenase